MDSIKVSYDLMADEDLLRGSSDRNDRVMDILLDRYKFLVKHEAKKLYIQGGDNDDLIQEGMIGLMKAINDYAANSEASFYTFAKLCISRQIYSAVKAAARNKHMPLNSYVSINGDENDEHVVDGVESIPSTNMKNEDPEKLYIGQEYEKAFTEALTSKLSDLEKEVLLLHIIGMDYQSIAKQMNKEAKSIDNALSRIKSKARSVLKEV